MELWKMYTVEYSTQITMNYHQYYNDNIFYDFFFKFFFHFEVRYYIFREL